MNKRKVLAILSVIVILFSVGYVLVNNWVTAQENGIVIEDNETNENDEIVIAGEDDETEDEVGKAEKQFDKLLKRLEKAEFKLFKAPASLIITSKGKATFVNADLAAIETVTPAESGILTVKIHGLNFDVDASKAKIYGGGKKITISDLQIGDKLLIKGVVNEETGIIEATRIHDRSIHKKSIDNLRARIQELLRKIEELRARLEAMRGD
ncbi:hypothetical protein KJA15_03630 [Patescibacteria group bacterium]|nr:hypothetical protein [Patescibacteria group bacterium]